MAGFASRQFERAKRLGFLVTRRPRYVLGRFATVRNGAHALIAGSSRRKRLSHLLGIARLTDAEAFQTYGREAERTLEGPAGFGFLEDASCYHKALPPESGDRLMLQLRYQ